MEGNAPTGALVLPEYVQLKNKLSLAVQSTLPGEGLRLMLDKMLEKTSGYLEKALKCETLVMAAILNPMLGLPFFEEHFDWKVQLHAETLIKEYFESCKRELDLETPVPELSLVEPPMVSSPSNPSNPPVYRTRKKAPTVSLQEFELYYNDDDLVPASKADDPMSILRWWKVGVFLTLFSSFSMI